MSPVRIQSQAGENSKCTIFVGYGGVILLFNPHAYPSSHLLCHFIVSITNNYILFKCTAYVTVVAFKRSEKMEALKITCTFQRKTMGKEWEFMITEYRREREGETDMCGSSQGKPLEAKVLNLALRSDESERFLVLHCVEQDLSPALCLLLLVVTTPRIYLIGSGTTGSITLEKGAKG